VVLEDNAPPDDNGAPLLDEITVVLLDCAGRLTEESLQETRLRRRIGRIRFLCIGEKINFVD
jgi:hypothetical protein